MSKLIRASVLVLLLACSASAGVMMGGSPPPPPPPPSQTTQVTQEPGAIEPEETTGVQPETLLLVRIALNLLALL
jgi:hypothetical protein